MNFFFRKHGEPGAAPEQPPLRPKLDPSLSSAQPDRETWRWRLESRTRLRERTRARQHGHTLTELMISMAVVMIVLAGVLASHVFGLRLFEMNKAKLGASDDARTAIGHMVTEIRSAKLIRIGNGSGTSFSEIAPNTPQRGNAVQVYPTANTNTFVRYFRDSDEKLKRLASGTATPLVIASCISNQVVFTAEDSSGAVLTNNDNNRVIGLTLQFLQLQYPTVTIGPGNLYDYYQLRAKITRRTLE